MKLQHRATKFAVEQHQGQTRNDGVTPYIVHPIRVRDRIAKITDDEEVIAAAVLHDVVEDCPATLSDIETLFGKRVAEIVGGLTNEFTKEKYPDLNRDERKKREFQRLKSMSHEVKLIKCADRLDNLIDIDFKLEKMSWIKTYQSESMDLLKALKTNKKLSVSDLFVALKDKIYSLV